MCQRRDTVHRFQDLAWPEPYACAVARFHHNVDDNRWVDTESFPVPHNPCKLPEAELANFRRAAAATSSLVGRVLGAERTVTPRTQRPARQAVASGASRSARTRAQRCRDRRTGRSRCGPRSPSRQRGASCRSRHGPCLGSQVLLGVAHGQPEHANSIGPSSRS